MLEIISIAAMTAVPVVDFIVVKDNGEKIRRAKLQEFYKAINK